ncbi:hypothetical protein [Rhizobium yanglingense]
MRQWCDEAGLFHCSAHGLREAGASIAAENGAIIDQLKAIFGWTTSEQAGLYTRAACRKKLSGYAEKLLMPDQNENKNVPLSEVNFEKWDKNKENEEENQRLLKIMVGPEGLEPPTKRL